MSNKDKHEAGSDGPTEAEMEELDAATGGTVGRSVSAGRFSGSSSSAGDGSDPPGRFSNITGAGSGLKSQFVSGDLGPADLQELEETSDPGRSQKR